MEVRQGFKKKRESEMVTRNGVSEHVKVYGEWFIMRIVGVREGSNKRVANENMGSTDLGEVKKMGKGIDAHPGNRTPVSTVGGYYDTTTPDALRKNRFDR
ncbi:hypothetical protein PanWU01x14_114580 [Parasponia andersonii]|uniref:Uncharacterized protein n=1 Tax=Parasponia andersonii TaxID=3476 RepID=A0A2P5CXK3_PARAD|nr:hypothetical protein PanWU01x14_114580 [Parasponia andersonii]